MWVEVGGLSEGKINKGQSDVTDSVTEYINYSST